MKCIHCGKEFKAKRASAKFDSSKCRLEYFRNAKDETLRNAKTENETLRPVSVTKEEVSVSDNVRDNETDNKSDKTEEDPSFTPNWKSNPNIENKDQAISYILNFMANDPKMDGVVISVKGINWIVGKGSVKPIS